MTYEETAKMAEVFRKNAVRNYSLDHFVEPKLSYYVVGGKYTGVDFKELETPVELGPFEDYEEAYKVWKGTSWANVDTCQYRLTIIKR